MEFTKTVSGDPAYLKDWPQMCVCGAQKGPMVATGIPYRAGHGVEDLGHIYLCRSCVTRAGRALGLVKGDELDRLQNAADELDQAQREIEARQATIDQASRTLAENEEKIRAQRTYIESLQGEIALHRTAASQIQALTEGIAA